jgi:WD40 repeat protein
MSPNILTGILLSWQTAQKHERLLIYFADNLAFRFWEALSGICSRTIPHPDSQVNRLCISPDKRFLAAAGHHTVKLYDIRSTNPAAVLTFEGHTGNITGVAFHCEGKWMVTSSEDGTKSKSLKQIVLRF